MINMKIIEGVSIFLDNQDLTLLLENGQIILNEGIILALEGGGITKVPITEAGKGFHVLIGVSIGREYKEAIVVPYEPFEREIDKGTHVVEGRTILFDKRDLSIFLEKGQIKLDEKTFLVLNSGGFKRLKISKVGSGFHCFVSRVISRKHSEAFIVPVEEGENNDI